MESIKKKDISDFTTQYVVLINTIKQFMRANNITEEQLVTNLNVTQKELNRIFRYDDTVPLDRLFKIAHYVGFDFKIKFVND